MATKSELAEKVQKLTRKLAEREQSRLDNIQLSRQLSEARKEIAELKAKLNPSAENKVLVASDLAMKKAAEDKLRRENAAK
jgi:hypothetical protein